MDVRGLRIVLTGAASGIGAATLRRLTDGGAEVITLDRVTLPDALAGRSVLHLVTDLTDPGSIDGAVDAIDEHLAGRVGGIDALCNVAGVPGTLPAATVLSVNFLGLRHLTESLAERLADGGSIVNVASIAGAGWPMHLAEVHRLVATASFADGLAWVADHPMDDARSYDFSKEVLLVWSMANCLRWWERGIRVNTVSPGPVETPILDAFRESMGHDRIGQAIRAVGRAGTPDDIAPAIVFLASRAAPWVNGTNLVADGGLLARSMSGVA